MASTRITNIYNPVTFARRIQEAQTTLNRFLSSGVAVTDGALQAQVSQGGNTGELSNYNPLAQGEPNYSSDDPATSSTPANVATGLQRFRLSNRNKSWSMMNLAREIALADPVSAITGSLGKYWATDDEQRIISTFLGLLADNVANDSGDMLIDVATDDAAAVTDAERIGGERIIDALQTLGDHKENVSILALHSQIHARLQKQGLLDYIRDADNNIMFQTYMGKRLIVDDSLPAVSGTNRVTYTCMLYAPGIVGAANGIVLVPSELQRSEASGNGGGEDIIHSRVSNVFHPIGFDFTSTTLSESGGTMANYADLQLAANWDRKFGRKNIPLAFIQVND